MQQMIIQYKLFGCNMPESTRRKRLSPIWKKFYSVYKFDYTVYHQLCDDVSNKEVLRWYFKNFYYLYISNFSLLIYYLLVNSLTKFDEPKIRELCFILDNNGNKQHLGDEKHIFRYKTMQCIYLKLYEYAKFPLFTNESLINRLTYEKDMSIADAGILGRLQQLSNRGYTIHFDEINGNQLEITGSEMLPLKARLRIHIKLLKHLKHGGNL